MSQTQLLDLSLNLHLYEEAMQLYRDSFEEEEREDEKTLLENIKTQTYKMFVYVEEKEVLGLWILDINAELEYVLFLFLCTKESVRGRGLGTQLCLDAIRYFNESCKEKWLLIEAKRRQEKLYKKLGFKTLEIEYNVPAFNSSLSIKMALMLIQKEKDLDKETLRKIITDNFVRGYGVEEDDPRLLTQLLNIKLN